MSKKTVSKVLAFFRILIAGIVLIESVFILDCLITKSKSNEEITRTFTDFLSEKQYFWAYHLMCLGAQSNLSALLAPGARYNSKNVQKYTYSLEKVEGGPGSNISTFNLSIYPENNQNPDGYGTKFGLLRGSVPILSPCIRTQAG